MAKLWRSSAAVFQPNTSLCGSPWLQSWLCAVQGEIHERCLEWGNIASLMMNINQTVVQAVCRIMNYKSILFSPSHEEVTSITGFWRTSGMTSPSHEERLHHMRSVPGCRWWQVMTSRGGVTSITGFWRTSGVTLSIPNSYSYHSQYFTFSVDYICEKR